MFKLSVGGALVLAAGDDHLKGAADGAAFALPIVGTRIDALENVECLRRVEELSHLHSENTNDCLLRTTKKREEVVYAIAVVGDELQETVRVGGRLHFQVELPGLRGLLVHYVCTRTKRVQVVKRQQVVNKAVQVVNESVKLKTAMKTEEAVAYSSERATR